MSSLAYRIVAPAARPKATAGRGIKLLSLGVIYQKLQVNNRTQAALVTLGRGWVELDPEQ
jgi:hypothetical protein